MSGARRRRKMRRMRTWTSAEHILRRELTAGLRRRPTPDEIPLVIAVGGRRPQAVIALGHDQDIDDALTDIAMVAAAFHPTRAMVAISLTRSDRRDAGMAVCCDATWVPDGFVEMTRVWPWHRIGSRILWPRVELAHWDSYGNALPRTTAAILNGARAMGSSDCLDELLRLTRAAGHRVRLAR